MTNDVEKLQLDKKFFSALERGDSATIAQCYAPDMRIWNNVQQIEMTGAEHIAGLEAYFFGRFLNRRYERTRTDLLADGFVRQQVLSASVDGEPVLVPMCLVCRVSNGKIIRIDEYLTSSALPKL